MPHRRVGVSARSARRGRLAALGLGGQAQGYHRPLVPSGGWQHDEGLDPGLPGSQVAAGAGTGLVWPFTSRTFVATSGSTARLVEVVALGVA